MHCSVCFPGNFKKRKHKLKLLSWLLNWVVALHIYTACSSMKTKFLDSVQLLPLFRELVSFLSGKSMMNLEGFCLILYFFS